MIASLGGSWTLVVPCMKVVVQYIMRGAPPFPAPEPFPFCTTTAAGMGIPLLVAP